MALTGELLLSLAVKSTLVLAGAALLAKALGRASAAVRHLVWSAALAGLLLLPLASEFVPTWRPPLPAGIEIVQSQAPIVLDVVARRSGFSLSAAALAWGIWAIGVAIVLAHTAVGMVKIGRILRRTQPLCGYGPGVLVSRDVPIPAVCGLWRPRIVLPEDALSWPAARLRMVLNHELMHISRHDTRMHLVAQVASALYWPNPLVWWAAGCLRREAERACDDGVLEQGESPAVYAGELIEIVQSLRTAGELPQGGLAMGRISELEHRLKAMLKSGSSRRRATPLLVGGACALSLVALFPVAALRAPAQQTGGITGVVRDASGANVPKARVTVQLDRSDRREFAVTGATGQFSLQPLPEGTYTVTVAKQGFAQLRLAGIAVKPGAPTEVQAVLHIGQVDETVEVRGERPSPPPPPPPPPAPGASSTTSQQIRVGGNVQQAKLDYMARPSYPPDCRAEGIEGTVLLRAIIGMEGGVLNLRQVNELVDQRLVAAATEAVKQWRYKPTFLNGQPVEVITEIEVNFTLQN